jgi:4-hydroxy-tetrahydrodipicolinate reductase
MGLAIESSLLSRGHEVVAKGGRTSGGGNGNAEVAFEFTTPEAGEANVRALLEKRCAVVSGTTGWDVVACQKLAAELSVPFLHSSNFSIGVAVLRRVAASAASLLAPFPEFEAGIVERHHSKKKDAPSGTAKTLAAACEAAGKAAPVVSLRQGGQPGEHAVIFDGPDESLELLHRARSRGIFATGAVAAAEWLLASGRRGPVSFDEFLDECMTQGALHRRAPRTPQAG